jgi:hypothetical protein
MSPPIHTVRFTEIISVSPLISKFLDGLVSEIDFNSVKSGDVIDNTYTQYGVTFDAVSLNNQMLGSHIGSVFASNIYNVANSDPLDTTGPENVASIIKPTQNAGFDDTAGGIRVRFDAPQLYVSIDVRPIISAADRTAVGNNRPYLLVFGMPPAVGHPPMMAMRLSPLATSDPKFETWQTMDFLSTSATPDIGSIVFTCSHTTPVPSVFGLFDRLRFGQHLPEFPLFPQRLG